MHEYAIAGHCQLDGFVNERLVLLTDNDKIAILWEKLSPCHALEIDVAIVLLPWRVVKYSIVEDIPEYI